MYAPITPRQVELYKGILDQTILGMALGEGVQSPALLIKWFYRLLVECWCDGAYLLYVQILLEVQKVKR